MAKKGNKGGVITVRNPNLTGVVPPHSFKVEDVITELKTGEALVSFLDTEGRHHPENGTLLGFWIYLLSDLMIFGSPRLTHSLQGLGLVDEYLLFVNPLLLGDGVPLFERTGRSLPLRLLDGRRFASGVVLLRYEVGGS